MAAGEPIQVLASLVDMIQKGHFTLGDLATELRRAGMKGQGLQGILDMVGEVTGGTSTLEDMGAILGPKEASMLNAPGLQKGLGKLLTSKGLIDKEFTMSPEGAASSAMGDEARTLAMGGAQAPSSVLSEVMSNEASVNPAAAAELAAEAASQKAAGKASKGKLLESLKKELGTSEGTTPKSKQMKAIPSIFSFLSKKLQLGSSGDAAMNPEKRMSQFLGDMMEKIDSLPKGKVKTDLSNRLYGLMVQADNLEEGGGLTAETLKGIQGVGRDLAEHLDTTAAKAAKSAKKPFVRPPVPGGDRARKILQKLQVRMKKGTPGAVEQMDKLSNIPNLPNAAKVYGDKMGEVAQVSKEATKSLPMVARGKATLRNLSANKGLLSPKNLALGGGALVGGSLISTLLERYFPAQELDLASASLEEGGVNAPRSTEELLAEMRANQDIQTRMMNASSGVNPKILQFLQQNSKPPMTSTQQFIGPNPLLQGLASGQVSLEQLLGRG